MRRVVRISTIGCLAWAVVAGSAAYAQVLTPSPAQALTADAATDGFASDSVPHITSDGQGVWIAVWESSNDLGGAIGTDNDILYSRSTDNGSSWSSAAALNTNAAIDGSSYDFEARIVVSEAGTWLTVWQSNNTLGGTIGTDWDCFVSRSTDSGTTWSPPAALNTTAVSDGSAEDWYPRVATDDLGNWVAVWGSNNSLGGTIGTDSDILVSRSADDGVSWSVPKALNSNAAIDNLRGDGDPRIATDAQGTWIAIWQSAGLWVSRSVDAGATWSSRVLLDPASENALGFDADANVVADGLGAWFVVYGSNRDLGGTIGNDWDILIQRSADGGVSWSAPRAISAPDSPNTFSEDTLP